MRCENVLCSSHRWSFDWPRSVPGLVQGGCSAAGEASRQVQIRSRRHPARRCGCAARFRRRRRRSCRRRCGRSARRRQSPRPRGLTMVVGHDDFEFHLGQEIDDIFGAAIEFGMALLPAEALGLGDGDAGNADFVQRLLHLVQLEGLDDRFDLFHSIIPCRLSGRLGALAYAGGCCSYGVRRRTSLIRESCHALIPLQSGHRNRPRESGNCCCCGKIGMRTEARRHCASCAVRTKNARFLRSGRRISGRCRWQPSDPPLRTSFPVAPHEDGEDQDGPLHFGEAQTVARAKRVTGGQAA